MFDDLSDNGWKTTWGGSHNSSSEFKTLEHGKLNSIKIQADQTQNASDTDSVVH